MVQVRRNAHVLAFRRAAVRLIREVVIVDLLYTPRVEMIIPPKSCLKKKSTCLVLREVDGLLRYPWTSHWLHEQARVANVELIVYGKASFVLGEHHEKGPINPSTVNRERKRKNF